MPAKLNTEVRVASGLSDPSQDFRKSQVVEIAKMRVRRMRRGSCGGENAKELEDCRAIGKGES